MADITALFRMFSEIAEEIFPNQAICSADIAAQSLAV
jgi:hypothetical protein